MSAFLSHVHNKTTSPLPCHCHIQEGPLLRSAILHDGGGGKQERSKLVDVDGRNIEHIDVITQLSIDGID